MSHSLAAETDFGRGIQFIYLFDYEEELPGRQKLTQEEWKQVDQHRRWSLAGETSLADAFRDMVVELTTHTHTHTHSMH